MTGSMHRDLDPVSEQIPEPPPTPGTVGGEVATRTPQMDGQNPNPGVLGSDVLG